jgi:hypothetical protein
VDAIHPTEQLQRAGLRCGGERKERQVGLLAPGRHGSGERILGRVGQLVRRRGAVGRAQHLLQLGGRLAGLAAVGLVHDHRIGAVGERVDLLGDVGELLQRRDDDAGLLAGERLGQLGGVLVDALHHTVHVLELVDRVLQLLVEYPPGLTSQKGKRWCTKHFRGSSDGPTGLIRVSPGSCVGTCYCRRSLAVWDSTFRVVSPGSSTLTSRPISANDFKEIQQPRWAPSDPDL